MFNSQNRYLIALLLLMLGGLNSFILSPSPAFLAFVLFCTAIVVFSLLQLGGESSEDSFTLYNLLPGHYLLLLALSLSVGPEWLLFSLWGLAVLGTIAFDYFSENWGDVSRGKLTLMVSYCIIWGVVFFLLQVLVQHGFDLSGSASLLGKIAIAGLGLFYVILGLYRLERYQERRSAI